MTKYSNNTWNIHDIQIFTLTIYSLNSDLGIVSYIMYDPGQKSLGHPTKMCKIRNLWKTPRVSLLPFLYDTVLVTVLPPHPPSNVESACNDSGCEGRFESTLHGVGGEMRGFERFLQKCPKSFGQDCSSCMSLKSWGTNLLISYAS